MTWSFPAWTNKLRVLLAIGVIGGLLYVATVVNFGFSPDAVAVGYQPEQPVPFSHALHAGELAMDCRYCHNTVDRAKHAAVPPTETCMGCHLRIHEASPKLEPVRESWVEGTPVRWIRVHDLADYSYFDHSAHVAAGVGCVSCHGRIDQMAVVQQVEPLSMGWCLDCHRNPTPHLRPKHLVTQMEPLELAQLQDWQAPHIDPSRNCSTCHR